MTESAKAAEEGMTATIPLVARKGRASYLGERSAGHQDPGATSTPSAVESADRNCAVMTKRKGGVALVLVSHSKALAEGVAALARQMVGDGVTIICAAGAGEDGSELGIDTTGVLEAIIAADNRAGTVVFMDLGSAILSTEMALDLAEPQIKERVLLSSAPFVEGAVTAAVASAAGAPREALVAEASRALAPKVAQLGATGDLGAANELDEAALAAIRPPGGGDAPEAIAEATIRDPHGLHARPAGQVAALAGRFRADVSIRNSDNGKGPANARSLIALMSLAGLAGHRLRIAATGADAREAASALRTLIEGFTGDVSDRSRNCGRYRLRRADPGFARHRNRSALYLRAPHAADPGGHCRRSQSRARAPASRHQRRDRRSRNAAGFEDRRRHRRYAGEPASRPDAS